MTRQLFLTIGACAVLLACDGSKESDRECCMDASSTARPSEPSADASADPTRDEGRPSPSDGPADARGPTAPVGDGGRTSSSDAGSTDAAVVGDGGEQEDHHHSVDEDADIVHVDAGPLECDAPATCGLVECAVPQEEGIHVPSCSAIAPHSNPPTSGAHYPSWAQFGIYEEPIDPGFFLHTLEHSAVALLYNCDRLDVDGGSCDDLVSALLDFYAAFPEDPLCSDVPHRLVVAPDPGLDVPFAAVAWGYHLKGNCFDESRVAEFVEAHYGQNYEDLCNPGIDPNSAGCE